MQELLYFKDWKSKFQTMIQTLETTPNIEMDYVSLGEGLSDAAIQSIEQELGQPLPAAVKEFYQLFGHIKVLWHFKKPFIKGKETYTNSNFFCLHSGQHQGSMHIMPLRQVLFTDWKAEQHNLPEDANLKIFDYYSLYHMLAFDLDGADPIVYLGEDHGAGFTNTTYSFSSYLHVLLGVYGYLNRFRHLQLWTLEQQDSLFQEANWQLAAKDFVSLDFLNQQQIKEFVQEKWEGIEEAMQAKDYDRAYDLASNNLWEYDVKANGVVLDVLSIRGDEAGYFEWLGYALDDNFDLATYEATTSYPTFIQTERYQTLKNKK